MMTYKFRSRARYYFACTVLQKFNVRHYPGGVRSLSLSAEVADDDLHDALVSDSSDPIVDYFFREAA